jgi:photosystem II stability/assembly factor-like uncharacterized protein
MAHLPLVILAFAAPLAGNSDAQEPTTPQQRMQAWEQHQQMAQDSPFRDLRWREAGPKFQGGRIEAMAWPEQQPQTIYLGIGSGGVFKTSNGGRTWTSLFDQESTTAIGSVAVAPSDPETVWVGTGETHPSGTSFAGTGIFKSTDGGGTWQNMGLHDSHHIARVLIDPQDSNTVYAGVMGHHRSNNGQRGVYKTIDGGKSWQQMLFISDSVRVVDLVMDPLDSTTIYAAIWDPRGDQSGLNKSVDAGKTWTKLSNGLPPGADTGRIGFDVSRTQKDLIYALVVNRSLSSGRRPGGAEVYRSEDGGKSFARTHKEPLATWIGWDFCDLRIAPDDSDRIYVCGTHLLISQDAGKTFQRAGEKIIRVHSHQATVLHLDMHEIVLDSATPGRVLLGTDGGLYISKDHAQSWLHINNLPIGEFYTVHLDMENPYQVWGGTQDNASLFGPSTYVVDSVSPDPWQHVFLDPWGGGDGFVTLRDPTDSKMVYVEQQNGAMRRKQLNAAVASGKGDRWIKPKAAKDETPLRFAWNTPFILSHHQPKTVYCAAQRVFMSTNRGDDWTVISPDLTSQSILSLSESSLNPDVLYAASGQGEVEMTKDRGKTWTSAAAGLAKKHVTKVMASQHVEAVAFASLTGTYSDDFRPYLFRTADFGQSWQPIHAGLPAEPIFTFAEDPVHANLLYVGTQSGVYVTLDSGASWISLCTQFPSVPVFDLAVHPRDHELVAATHGRSIFILNLRLIHAAAAQDTTEQIPTGTDSLRK